MGHGAITGGSNLEIQNYFISWTLFRTSHITKEKCTGTAVVSDKTRYRSKLNIEHELRG